MKKNLTVKFFINYSDDSVFVNAFILLLLMIIINNNSGNNRTR